MESNKKNKKRFGLLGRNISYSFSRGYFTEKFELLDLEDYEYVNFDIQNITDFKTVVQENTPHLNGMNVTVPYKEKVIPFLDKLHKKARKIGAINTIRITKKGKLKGYNTDEYGFRNSLKPLLKKQHKKALIFGTGGASKAIAYSLKKMGIKYSFISRNPTKDNEFSYEWLSKEVLEEYHILINCTPLGTHPNVESCIDIPYEFLTTNHLLYDLVYNPKITLFLEKGKKQGATIKNGLEMLELQAEKAWKIWNK